MCVIEQRPKQLKHPQILEYLEPYLSYLTVAKIEECSAARNIHPAIIIGALAINKKISFRNQSLYKEDVVELIPAKFIHESLMKQ